MSPKIFPELTLMFTLMLTKSGCEWLRKFRQLIRKNRRNYMGRKPEKCDRRGGVKMDPKISKIDT